MNCIKTSESYARALKRTAILILSVLSLIGLVSGCTNNNVTPREGSVQGKVLNQSGSPVEDALVTWAYDDTRWCLTDEQGAFFIEAVGFGEQLFNIEAFGYRTSQFKASVYSGRLTTVEDLSIEPKSFDYLEIEVEEVSATHALISWKTTDYTNGIIEYGENESLGRTVREPAGEYATTHSLTIKDLSPEKTYFFKIIASRENRAAETSSMSSFTTLNNLEDKTPPAPPTNVETALTSSPNMVTVFWAPVADLDLKGYKVYRAENANSAFSLISNMLIPKGQERYTDVSVTPGKKYFYRVTSIDQAGNESGFHNITNMLVPGDISTEVTWTRANSPYIIAGDITVLETGRINIDAGVEVLMQNYDSFKRNDPDRIDIIISGALVASAGNQLAVVFASSQVNPEKDSWNGIRYENTDNPANTLLNVKISDAPVGLAIDKSTGTFAEIEILNCETGIKCSNIAELTLASILTHRCTSGIEAGNNTNLIIKDSTFFHPTTGINSTNNDGINISGCNFLEYTDIGLLSNEAGGEISITNNLFVSPADIALKSLSHNPIIEYNTFDSPYAIQISEGNPVIRKNIFLADRSVFDEGKKAIEHLAGELPLPEFGPNNVYGFPEGNDYIGCTATSDSTAEDILLMREITGDEYDYRLRQAFPDADDPWGIQRETIPYEN
jgi:hypothetical protein